MSSNEYAISLQCVQDAAERIDVLIHKTPVLTCSYVDRLVGNSIHFKCETFQRSGAFKFRGAANAVYSLSDEQAANGVVTHSSGNHGGALALAAQLRGVAATVIVPDTTPQCKRDAITGSGAKLHLCEASMSAREAACARLQATTGATFIAPYNDPAVMAGQGTMALELMEQVPDLDVVVVPVSGGGMISGVRPHHNTAPLAGLQGVATVVKALRPDTIVIAAEPTGTNGMADVEACKAAGSLVQLPSKPLTIADGLQGRLGDLTWPIVRDLVDSVITVAENEIVAAMRVCFERLKVVVEPSGAVGLAAALSPAFRSMHAGKRVGVILCGGNIDFESVGFWQAWGRKAASDGQL